MTGPQTCSGSWAAGGDVVFVSKRERLGRWLWVHAWTSWPFNGKWAYSWGLDMLTFRAYRPLRVIAQYLIGASAGRSRR